jgi:hypothetical protein
MVMMRDASSFLSAVVSVSDDLGTGDDAFMIKAGVKRNELSEEAKAPRDDRCDSRRKKSVDRNGRNANVAFVTFACFGVF